MFLSVELTLVDPHSPVFLNPGYVVGVISNHNFIPNTSVVYLHGGQLICVEGEPQTIRDKIGK